MVLRRELLVSSHFSYSVYYYGGNDRLPTTPSFLYFSSSHSLSILPSKLRSSPLPKKTNPKESEKQKEKREENKKRGGG
jgi:hypothetical protein